MGTGTRRMPPDLAEAPFQHGYLRRESHSPHRKTAAPTLATMSAEAATAVARMTR